MKETVYGAFLFSILRHILSMVTGILVAKGIVTTESADEFTTTAAIQISAAIITFATALWLSYRDKIWNFLKVRVGIWMPPNSTPETVAEIAGTVQNKAAVAKGQADGPEGAVFMKDGGAE
jgi:hypothetical protein